MHHPLQRSWGCLPLVWGWGVGVPASSLGVRGWGVCLWSRGGGVCLWSRECLPLVPGGVWPWGSVSGRHPPAHRMLGYNPLWTDTCKNITFKQLLLQSWPKEKIGYIGYISIYQIRCKIVHWNLLKNSAIWFNLSIYINEPGFSFWKEKPSTKV